MPSGRHGRARGGRLTTALPSRARARPAVVVAICVGLAVASFAIPAAIAYDPYAWLVWGREAARLQLDTTGGPSWKPLPVLVTTLVGPVSAVAPALWLVVARAGALLAIVGVFRVASRFAGLWASRWAGRWAGAVAAVVLVCSPDPGPRFVRLYLEGHSAPLTAALAVWAIDRHLDGKHGSALVLGALLALDRPEAWPFLGLYAVWVWRRDRRLRPLTVALGVAVPVLWFGGDWWGSGSPFHGADSARVLTDDGNRFVDGVRRVAEVVIAPAWIAAGIAVVDAWRRRDRTLVVLGAGALAWFVLVVGTSAAFGYAALSRFLLPGAAVVCVLAGVGTVRLLAWFPTGRARIVTVVVVVLVAVPAVAVRGYGIPGQVDEVVERARTIEDLDTAIDAAGGADRLLGCGRISARDAGVPRVALAWDLDVPMARVETRPGRVAGVAVEPRGATPERRAARVAARTGRPVEILARTRHWVVLGIDCPPAT